VLGHNGGPADGVRFAADPTARPPEPIAHMPLGRPDPSLIEIAATDSVTQAAARVGLDLPLRVLVWDDGGTTRLTYRDPRALATTHGIDGIDQVLAALQAGLDGLVTAAAG
jgi:Domain of unknown function DUF302